MNVDYKGFLAEISVFKMSSVGNSNFLRRDQKEDYNKWREFITNVNVVYEKIDILIYKLVIGAITGDEYNASKSKILQGDAQEYRKDGTGSDTIEITPEIRMSLSLFAMINTANITAARPVTTHVTELHFIGGGSVSVHEPIMEVTWKVKTTIMSIIETQESFNRSNEAGIDPTD